MRRVMQLFVIVGLLLGLTPAAFASTLSSVAATTAADETAVEYVVVYTAGASLDNARQAVRAAGGKILRETPALGVAVVTTSNAAFVSAVQQQASLFGVARHKPIGRTDPNLVPHPDDVEKLPPADGKPVERGGGKAGIDPLASLQWNMAMIDATAKGSYAKQAGDKRVLVGIIDSGIDASHPDLMGNVNTTLSRNFATDLPGIDGPCEYESCVDPATVDNNGHGTHVAGVVAARLNGLGIAGVAPNVSLVNVRGGQDSGYVFLQPVLDALVYSGDIGIDVVNMSFYIDPWLFNCTNNPADSPESQLEQRTTIEAVQRALTYARERSVTLIASMGNGHTDLGNPSTDTSSPNYPPNFAYPRPIDNASCLVLPTEGTGVISVTAIGPSKAKADYSNYGVEQATVAAPGGYFRDFFETPQYRQNSNYVLSTYPKSVLEASGSLADDGTPLSSTVIRDCQNGSCAYYAYLQGTSMAAPHATGVAALIVSQFGQKDGVHKGGLMLDPAQTEKLLRRTATDQACPEPRLVSYVNVGQSSDFDALCEGTAAFNGFYGDGIVNALKAVTVPRNSN